MFPGAAPHSQTLDVPWRAVSQPCSPKAPGAPPRTPRDLLRPVPADRVQLGARGDMTSAFWVPYGVGVSEPRGIRAPHVRVGESWVALGLTLCDGGAGAPRFLSCCN